MSNKLTKNELIELFEEIRCFSECCAENGTTRLAYSETDEKAHNLLVEKMKRYGFDIRRDLIGNVFARLPGKDPSLPVIGTGSHIDTVPQGGNFDGVVGVLCGLYALTQFKAGELKRGLELVIFRAEESSRFGFSCIGSKALTGKINVDKWLQNKDKQGLTVFDAIKQTGYSDGNITNENSEIANDYFHSFIEVHIEQGKRLEAENEKIGIVHGIAAPTRFCVTVRGQADHSGATPMHQRSDALLASTAIIQSINLTACKESIYGTVGTVGKLDLLPNSMNVIPGEVSFFVDIRGINTESIHRVVEGLNSAIEKAKADNSVQIAIREISCESPVKLDDSVCRVIEASCKEKGVSYMKMLSGAGHDAMYIAEKCPTAMIFIPSKGGISHHKDEFSHFDDVYLAAELLKSSLHSLANADG